MSREEFVAICRTWVGTPYHLRARVKGSGADCSTWIAESLIEAGLATTEQLYGGLNVSRGDWWCHAPEDLYRRRVMRHAQLVAETVSRPSTKALPGCILLQKAARSRVFNHGAVVTVWPHIIHAVHPCVRESSAVTDPMWNCQPVSIFDPFEGML